MICEVLGENPSVTLRAIPKKMGQKFSSAAVVFVIIPLIDGTTSHELDLR